MRLCSLLVCVSVSSLSLSLSLSVKFHNVSHSQKWFQMACLAFNSFLFLQQCQIEQLQAAKAPPAGVGVGMVVRRANCQGACTSVVQSFVAFSLSLSREKKAVDPTERTEQSSAGRHTTSTRTAWGEGCRRGRDASMAAVAIATRCFMDGSLGMPRSTNFTLAGRLRQVQRQPMHLQQVCEPHARVFAKLLPSFWS